MATTLRSTGEVRPLARSPLASRSVRVHVLRGVLGLAAAAAAILLVSVIGPVAISLLGVTVIARRGCPTCWTVGLMGALADERARAACSRCVAEP